MNDVLEKLVFRMVINTMTGDKEKTFELYEKYKRERYLYISIHDYIRWRDNHEQAN